jgi:hypothetical protein
MKHYDWAGACCFTSHGGMKHCDQVCACFTLLHTSLFYLLKLCDLFGCAAELFCHCAPVPLQPGITSGDFEISGVNNPFLQVKILRLLRHLGACSTWLLQDLGIGCHGACMPSFRSCCDIPASSLCWAPFMSTKSINQSIDRSINSSISQPTDFLSSVDATAGLMCLRRHVCCFVLFFTARPVWFQLRSRWAPCDAHGPKDLLEQEDWATCTFTKK